MKQVCIQIFLIAMLFAPCFSGQNYIAYYDQANEAEQLFAMGNLSSAEKSYLALEKEYDSLKPLENFYLGMIRCFNADTSGYSYLMRAAGTGFQAYDFARTYQIKYPTLFLSKLMMDDLKSIQNQMMDGRNKRIEDTLKYFFEQERIYANDTVPISERGKKIRTDFLLYLQQNGIPNLSIYGDFTLSWFSSHLAVYSDDSTLYKAYTAFLLRSVENGLIGPYYYCLLVDINLALVQMTRYGIFTIKSDKNTSKEEVILNRKKVGLSPYYDSPGRLFPEYPRF